MKLRVLLCCAGTELASSIQPQAGQQGMTVMLLTTAAIVATKSTGLGFLIGVSHLRALHSALHRGGAHLLPVSDKSCAAYPRQAMHTRCLHTSPGCCMPDGADASDMLYLLYQGAFDSPNLT